MEIALTQTHTQINTLSHSDILAEMDTGTITTHTHTLRVLGIIAQRRYFYVPIATRPNQLQVFEEISTICQISRAMLTHHETMNINNNGYNNKYPIEYFNKNIPLLLSEPRHLFVLLEKKKWSEKSCKNWNLSHKQPTFFNIQGTPSSLLQPPEILLLLCFSCQWFTFRKQREVLILQSPTLDHSQKPNPENGSF